MPIPTDQILQFSLFKELESKPMALMDLASMMKTVSFNVRDFIINEKSNEKSADDRMFFLLKGQVDISKSDESGQIVLIGKADGQSHPYFGESVLLGSFNRSASVVASSPCECLSLSAKDFEVFTERYPHVVAAFYRNLAQILFDRLSKADRDIFVSRITR